MRLSILFTTVFCFSLLLPLAVEADVRLYTGNLEVVKTSGKACAGRKGNHAISLVIGSDDSTNVISGYVGGDSVMVGQLSGSSLGLLSVRYPYPDAERAEGHTLRVEISGTALTGELHDRHLEDAVDDCNVDLARVNLLLIGNDEAANASYKRFSKIYEAKLARSTALSILRSGAHAGAGAVHVFEKALDLADDLYSPDSAQLTPYLTGLANSYIRTGRYQDFISLYNSRYAAIRNDAVRQIFNHHKMRSLLQVSKSALMRADYQVALDNARQALLIDYKNKDAISATMSALVRNGQHVEAITFLEETEKKLDSDPDRKDVREAIALVEYQKARKEMKAGRSIEAERSLRKAIKLDSGTTHYLIVLARWIHKTGKFSEADAILRRGLDVFKDETRRQELAEARDKLRQTEMILAKIRMAGF